MIGIYGIRNKINNKIYVGQSCQLKIRKNNHFLELRMNKHFNLHLQNSYNKHNEENFEWLILEECQEEELNEKEEKWIKSFDKVYNQILTPSNLRGENNPFYGKTHTQETKEKQKQAKIDKYYGANNPNFGNKNTQEVKLKMSENRSKTLNKDIVLKIVDDLKSGIPHNKIAEKFSIGRTVVTRISNGTRWTNVTGGAVVPIIYHEGKRVISDFHRKNKPKKYKKAKGG